MVQSTCFQVHRVREDKKNTMFPIWLITLEEEFLQSQVRSKPKLATNDFSTLIDQTTEALYKDDGG